MKKLISFLIFLLLASPVWATTYYIDCNAANDTDTGLVGHPWKTIAKVNSSTFEPGDSILFNRTCTWDGEQLVVPSSGISGSPITIDAYGTGALPIIKYLPSFPADPSLVGVRISLANGTAFVDAANGTRLINNVGKQITITDSAGKALVGWIKAAGTAETLDTEVLTNPGFEGTYTGGLAPNWTLVRGTATEYTADPQAGSSSQKISNPAGNSGLINQTTSSLTTDLLYKSSAYGKVLAGGGTDNITLGTNTIGGFNSFYWVSKTGYRTTTSTGTTTFNLYSKSNASADYHQISYDTVSLKKVLTPSSLGATIVSTSGGTTYNWASKDSGFNPNDTSYTVTIASENPATPWTANFSDVTGWGTSGNWTEVAGSVSYFGNTPTSNYRNSGSSLTSGNKATTYTCPGSGNQTVVELSAKCYQDGTGGTQNIRLAIYPADNTLCTANTAPFACCTGAGTGSCDTAPSLIAQGSAATSITAPTSSAWQANHAYSVGDVIHPTTPNYYLYRCTTAGTSGASEPGTWTNTVGNTVSDNGVVWTNDINNTASWQGHLTQASITPNPTVLVGGSNYKILVTTQSSFHGAFAGNSVTSGNALLNNPGAYIGGFPNPLSTQTNSTALFATRAGIGGTTNQWQIACSSTPTRLWLNGTEYSSAASAAVVDSTNRWYWDSGSGGVLTVYATSNPALFYTSMQGYGVVNTYYQAWAAPNNLRNRLFLDGTEYMYASSVANITSTLRYFYDNAAYRLYLYATSDPQSFYSTIKVSSMAPFDGPLHLSKDYVNISNLNLQGGHCAIQVNGANHCDLSGLTFGLYSWFGAEYGAQSLSEDNTYVDLHNSTYESGINNPLFTTEVGGDGIRFETQNTMGSQYCKIYSNTISNAAHSGINLTGYQANTMQNNEIYLNDISCPNTNYGRGIELTGLVEDAVTANLVYRNHLHNLATAAMAANGNHNKYYYNIINDVHYTPNEFTKTYQGGIYISYNPAKTGSDEEIYNNLIYNVDGHGIWFQADASHPIANNIIKNNIIMNWGLDTGHTYNAIKTADAFVGTQTISNNLFYKSGVTASVINWVSTDYTVAAFEAASGAGWTAANNVYGDPLFVSTTDFHLLPNSPAIDAGVDVSLTSDYSGAKVPQRAAPSIGAYEYIRKIVGHRIMPGITPIVAAGENLFLFESGDERLLESGENLLLEN